MISNKRILICETCNHAATLTFNKKKTPAPGSHYMYYCIACCTMHNFTVYLSLEQYKEVINGKQVQKKKSCKLPSYDKDQNAKLKRQIVQLCMKYKFKYRYIGQTIFLRTRAAGWYFDIKSPITLRHENTEKRWQPSYDHSDYHTQKGLFATAADALQYIAAHDKFILTKKTNFRYRKRIKIFMSRIDRECFTAHL